MNYGNTGQRYKMPKIERVEIDGKTVVRFLACGHQQRQVSQWITPEDLLAWWRSRIGSRERCNECKA